jgi:hypothetical protein
MNIKSISVTCLLALFKIVLTAKKKESSDKTPEQFSFDKMGISHGNKNRVTIHRK